MVGRASGGERAEPLEIAQALSSQGGIDLVAPNVDAMKALCR